MRLLMTGRGTSGSWQIRGLQLGAALGATVQPNATEVAGFDLAVLVKREAVVLERLRAARVPVVWDVVDGWPQPAGSYWTREDCMAWMRQQVRAIAPIAIVAATQAMADDLEEFGRPVLYLPHHARPGIATNPIRPEVRVVAYEGSARHLGAWGPWLVQECAARGWTFVANPASLADADIVVAAREADGYAPRHWKSNVKLANAQASGTPIVLQREAGYLETRTGGEFWADSQDEFRAGFHHLTPHQARGHAARLLTTRDASLQTVASTYSAWLSRLTS